MGRIAPDKRYMVLMDVFQNLFSAIPGAQFVIVGRVADHEHFIRLQQRAQRSGIPIEFEINVTDEKVREILGQSQFYVGAKPYEHFGISILEAVSAGCLPLVPDSGGQREIVPRELLRYNSPDQVAEKAAKLINDEDLRERTLAELRIHVQSFKPERFFTEIETAVQQLLHR